MKKYSEVVSLFYYILNLLLRFLTAPFQTENLAATG
jgi:hypothetical protein